MRTSFAAFRFALVGFTLPYMFVLRPELLMLGWDGGEANTIDIIYAVAIAILEPLEPKRYPDPGSNRNHPLRRRVAPQSESGRPPGRVVISSFVIALSLSRAGSSGPASTHP